MNDEVKDIIKQIHNRKGYSNPTRTLAEEEDDEPEKVVTKTYCYHNMKQSQITISSGHKKTTD